MSRAKRWKKLVVPPPEPPRDPRLVAVAEQAQRVGWVVRWQQHGPNECGAWWLWLQVNDVGVEVFVEEDGLICYAKYSDHWNRPSRTPVEALRSAYAALGVAIDQAEESGLGRLETPAQDSDA